MDDSDRIRWTKCGPLSELDLGHDTHTIRSGSGVDSNWKAARNEHAPSGTSHFLSLEIKMKVEYPKEIQEEILKIYLQTFFITRTLLFLDFCMPLSHWWDQNTQQCKAICISATLYFSLLIHASIEGICVHKPYKYLLEVLQVMWIGIAQNTHLEWQREKLLSNEAIRFPGDRPRRVPRRSATRRWRQKVFVPILWPGILQFSGIGRPSKRAQERKAEIEDGPVWKLSTKSTVQNGCSGHPTSCSSIKTIDLFGWAHKYYRWFMWLLCIYTTYIGKATSKITLLGPCRATSSSPDGPSLWHGPFAVGYEW